MPARAAAPFAMLALAIALTPATLSARHIPIRIFTTAQGLPRNLVNCMAPGATGMLWFCTSEGLARFDGLNFRVFGPEDGLPSRTVHDLVPSKTGGYWLVTRAGICRIPGNGKIGEPCRVFPISGPSGEFTTVFESNTGATYAFTSRDLFRLSADRHKFEQTAVHLPLHYQILTVADGNNGALLVCTATTIYAWKPGSPPRDLSASVGPLGGQSILRISPDTFLVAATNGLYRMTFQGEQASIVLVPLEKMQVMSTLLRRHDGSIWVSGVGGGIVRLAISRTGEIHTAERFSAADGIPSDSVTGLLEDAGNNLWASTDGSGIFRIADSGITAYTAQDGLGNERIASIFEDLEGRLIVQTSWDYGPTVHIHKNDRFEQVAIQHPNIKFWGWGWNQFVQAAHDGAWWVPTGEGLLRFPVLAHAEDLARTQPAALYRGDSPLGCRDVFRVFEDSAHDVWVSCIDPRKLVRWERKSGSFHTWNASDGLPDDSVVMAIHESPGKAHWLATIDAAVRFRNSRFEAFPLVPSGEHAISRDLLIDHAGRIWIATARAGVFRCDNPDDPHPTFRSYSTREGLSTNVVNSLVEDRAGFLYAGTVLGVDRIDPRAAIDSRRIRHFTAADGLPDSEQNTAFRDRRGHLWFGTLHGLAEFDPEKNTHLAPPDVHLMRVRVRGEEVPLPWEGTRSTALRLPPDKNQVEIEYAGIDLRWAQSLRYQYRLNGADSAWSAPVEQRSVNYARLPSGQYRFEVRALDSDGQTSPEPAGFDLTIDIPFWRRWWFLTALSIALVATGGLLYDYRVRNLLALERLRTRIATDLHDDIGASLTQISVLSELAHRDSEPRAMADVAELARSMVQDMSDIVWAIKPGHDQFESLVHRMRRFAGDTLSSLELDFNAASLPPDFTIPLDARRPLYLVFKEAVNNVSRHAGASRVSISLTTDGTTFTLKVKDDGRGFRHEDEHNGEGLASIARRMRHLGGTAVWDSQPGGGTVFTATLPLRPHPYLPELMGRFRHVRR